MKSILIVEDEPNISDFIKGELEYEGYNVSIKEDGRKGLEEALRNEYDLVILDVMLPSMNGFEICRRLKREKQSPVIMLSAKDRVMDKVNGLQIGADDYITKPFIVDELVARVKAHLRREKRRNSIGNNIIKIGEIEIHKDSYEVYLNKELIDLSTREFQLFLYLCENAGQVLSREQIFNSVWGSDFGDIGTVAVNIKSLRDKIDKENKYIKTIWGVGYKLIKPIGEVI